MKDSSAIVLLIALCSPHVFWAVFIVFVWRFETQVERLFNICACRGWGYDDESKCGMEAAAALLVGAVVQMLALGAFSLQQTEATIGALIVYGLAAFIPIVGLAFLVWSHRNMNNQAFHSFDQSTVRFSGTGFVIVSISLFLLGAMYINNVLIAAEPVLVPLESHTAETHRFESGILGVKAVYEFQPKLVRNPFEVNVSVDRRDFSDWKIVDVDGNVQEGDRWVTLSVPPVKHDPVEGGATRVFFYRLTADRKYQLVLYLQSPDGKGPTPADTAVQINNGKAVSAAYIAAK